jgi:hypothetical protein
MAPTSQPLSSAHAERTSPDQPTAVRLEDDLRAAARIPDSVATLSYGTQVLARPGGGPRIF